MKRTVLTYGILSGLVSSTLMIITMGLLKKGTLSYNSSEVVGYACILLSFAPVVLGIRSARSHQPDRGISFGRAFGTGILITFISCLFYVITWEIIYFGFWPDFVDQFTSVMTAKMKADGISPEIIADEVRNMADYKKMLDNPLTNAGVTFTEPFPVGLVVSLVSALVLKRKRAQ